MTIKDWIDVAKAFTRMVVTIVFSVCWVVRYFSYGDAGMDTFTLLTVGMLAWYFGESLFGGLFNRLSLKKE